MDVNKKENCQTSKEMYPTVETFTFTWETLGVGYAHFDNLHL